MPMISLTAADGHRLTAYRAGPQNAARALVVVQEIFGVNRHIRTVADRFAAEGYARATGKAGVCMGTSGPGARPSRASSTARGWSAVRA